MPKRQKIAVQSHKSLLSGAYVWSKEPSLSGTQLQIKPKVPWWLYTSHPCHHLNMPTFSTTLRTQPPGHQIIIPSNIRKPLSPLPHTTPYLPMTLRLPSASKHLSNFPSQHLVCVEHWVPRGLSQWRWRWRYVVLGHCDGLGRVVVCSEVLGEG